MTIETASQINYDPTMVDMLLDPEAGMDVPVITVHASRRQAALHIANVINSVLVSDDHEIQACLFPLKNPDSNSRTTPLGVRMDKARELGEHLQHMRIRPSGIGPRGVRNFLAYVGRATLQ